MNIQEKKLGGGGELRGVEVGLRGGVRVDVIEELKFLGKIKKKIRGGGLGRGGGGGVDLVGGQGGCE